jgi:hypothetical protein
MTNEQEKRIENLELLPRRYVARCVLLSSPDWNLHSQFSYQGEGCSPAPGNQLLRTRIGHLRLGWYPSGPTMPDATSGPTMPDATSGPTMPDATSGPTMPDASTDSLSFV